MGLLASLFASWNGVASAEAAQAGGFCQAEFPQIWQQFVDHVVDTAYNKNCTAEPDPEPAELPPLRVPAAKRLVAIGDLHGDLEKATRAFRLAGLINDKGVWVGGDTVCVQVGDILDRGDQEVKLLYMLERLQRQAAAAGGALYVLNGNHETMNVAGNFKYATAGADLEIAAWKRWRQLGQRLRDSCSSCSKNPASSIDAASVQDTPVASSSGRGAWQFNPLREAALRPGGPITRRFFAPHPVVLQVGSTLFVHGGILPSHVEYGLENINKETREWLLGNGNNGGGGRRHPPPRFLRGADAIVWARYALLVEAELVPSAGQGDAVLSCREYSAREESRCDCDTLQQVLQALPGAERMVVGHTIQDRGINSACEGKVLRVDVGLSKGCGNGDVQVLEIMQDGQQIVRLAEGQAPQVLSQPTQPQQQQQQQPGEQQNQHKMLPGSAQQQLQPQLASVVEQSWQEKMLHVDGQQQTGGEAVLRSMLRAYGMLRDELADWSSSSSSNNRQQSRPSGA